MGIGEIAEVIWPLALKNEGSRLVQKALEVADVTEQCLLVKRLRGHVLRAATAAHANHVIQKCIEVMYPPRLEFIIDELRGHAVHVAETRCGCRVLERVLEHCPGSQTTSLVEELMVQPILHFT